MCGKRMGERLHPKCMTIAACSQLSLYSDRVSVLRSGRSDTWGGAVKAAEERNDGFNEFLAFLLSKTLPPRGP